MYDEIIKLQESKEISYVLIKGFDSSSIIMEILINNEAIKEDNLINVLPLGIYAIISTNKLEMYFD
jgi:hypothetical protein